MTAKKMGDIHGLFSGDGRGGGEGAGRPEGGGAANEQRAARGGRGGGMR